MENDSQITACDAKVLRYFRKHGSASTADAKRCLQMSAQPDTANTVNTDVSRLVTIDSTT